MECGNRVPSRGVAREVFNRCSNRGWAATQSSLLNAPVCRCLYDLVLFLQWERYSTLCNLFSPCMPRFVRQGAEKRGLYRAPQLSKSQNHEPSAGRNPFWHAALFQACEEAVSRVLLLSFSPLSRGVSTILQIHRHGVSDAGSRARRCVGEAAVRPPRP